jgi:hypothetical protein
VDQLQVKQWLCQLAALEIRESSGRDEAKSDVTPTLRTPVIAAQIRAAGWVYDLLPGWRFIDTALQALADAVSM